ncbi:MAG: RdgB/HAM1 family non-canonical purine NTP pyrophosphatase [Candidatus Bipolaricaulota bacterium]|nr:RdgB/HAM1 family non-canonical purine NTP pyrophosphatase [Candidatus Bipolaricaulota bacterium]
MNLLLGTTNPGKLREILSILGDIPGIRWLTPAEVPVPDVPETGRTFLENALLKARTVAAATGHATLAEDSGLEVDALGGAPGVQSARYAGDPPDYAANNAQLLATLAGVTDRRARFRTVAALALPDGRVWTTEGVLEGRIADAPRGPGGFGYDPLFIPAGETRTLAELSPEEKNALSHRRRALEGLRPVLIQLAAESPGSDLCF